MLVLLALALFAGGIPFAHAQSLLVANGGTNPAPGENVLRYDTTNGAYQGPFATGGGLSGPVGIAYAQDGDLYVISGEDTQIRRYDGKTGAFKSVFVNDPALMGPTALPLARTAIFLWRMTGRRMRR